MTEAIYNLQFDIGEAEKSNVLISGGNHSGKTRLACSIASILQKFDWQVLAFDNSGVWKQISDIPYYTVIEPQLYYWKTPVTDTSLIYDISNLLPSSQKIFVNSILHHIWNTRTNHNEKRLMIIMEEAQLYMRNIRGDTAEHILRLMSVGRNKQTRLTAITVDLALLDSAFTRLCAIRYHGLLNPEENAKRKFRSYYGKQWLNVVQELETGEFIYFNKRQLEKIKAPLFKTQWVSRDLDEKLELSVENSSGLIAKLRRLFK